MQGTCPTCREWQAKGIPDYCCLPCTLQQSGMNLRLTTREGQPTIIEFLP